MAGEPLRSPGGDATAPLPGAGTSGAEPIVGPGGRPVDDRLGPGVLLQNLPDALIAVSPEGIVRFWSHGAERTFGYSAADALGRPITDLHPRKRGRRPTQRSRGDD